MHSIVFVLLPPDATELLKKARELLAPFDQNLEVPAYKDYLTNEQIRHWIEKLGTMSLDELARRLAREYAYEARVDELGIYELTTFNRNGHWDYWRPIKYLPNDQERTKRWGKELAQSVCLARELPPDKNIPHSIVTPDGKWHDVNDFGYKTILQYEKGGTGLHPQNVEPMAKWENHVRDILGNHSNHVILVLDCHS